MKKRVTALFLCFILLFCFGCSRDSADGKSSGKGDGRTVKIVTSFYPMYIFTKNLTKDIDAAKVVNLTAKTGGCIHDYTLLPQDMVSLNDAALFVANGAGMEDHFIGKIEEQLPKLKIADASKGIDLISLSSTPDGKEHFNAHVWLSVKNALKQIDNIADALKEAMPEYADKIERNRQEYAKKLSALDGEIKSELAPYKNTPVMTFHEAYSYFAADYGLVIVDTIETDEGDEPSAKDIARLSSEIKEKHVKALFTEPEYKGNSATILANETGVKVYRLNPITSGSGALTSYEDTMRQNLSVIKEAVG